MTIDWLYFVPSIVHHSSHFLPPKKKSNKKKKHQFVLLPLFYRHLLSPSFCPQNKKPHPFIGKTRISISIDRGRKRGLISVFWLSPIYRTFSASHFIYLFGGFSSDFNSTKRLTIFYPYNQHYHHYYHYQQ